MHDVDFLAYNGITNDKKYSICIKSGETKIQFNQFAYKVSYKKYKYRKVTITASEIFLLKSEANVIFHRGNKCNFVKHI